MLLAGHTSEERQNNSGPPNLFGEGTQNNSGPPNLFGKGTQNNSGLPNLFGKGTQNNSGLPLRVAHSARTIDYHVELRCHCVREPLCPLMRHCRTTCATLDT